MNREAIESLHAKARSRYLSGNDPGLRWWDIAVRCGLVLAYGRSDRCVGPAGRLP